MDAVALGGGDEEAAEQQAAARAELAAVAASRDALEAETRQLQRRLRLQEREEEAEKEGAAPAAALPLPTAVAPEEAEALKASLEAVEAELRRKVRGRATVADSPRAANRGDRWRLGTENRRGIRPTRAERCTPYRGRVGGQRDDDSSV